MPASPFPDLILDAELAPVGRWRRWRAAAADGRPLDVLCAEGGDAARWGQIAALLPALAHPHLLRCHRAAVDADGRRWVLLDALPAWNLADHLAHAGALEAGVAVRLVRELAHALAPAHARELTHRAIDAQVVLLERVPATAADPFPYRVLLGGLGLADDAIDERDEDPRHDVAALGRLLRRCLHPQAPEAPLPAGLSSAVHRLAGELAQPPADRPVDGASAAAACDDCLAGPAGAHRAAAWTVVLAALLAALASLAWTLFGR